MPRKPLYYTHEFPYHVRARSNNREWFYLPIDMMWKIFTNKLNKISLDYGATVHAFVLMDNHYHLLLTTSDKHDLGEVMQVLQKSVSRKVNELAGRINHVFGGPYEGSLITTEFYYFQALKYVYRNPVKAGLCTRVEDYLYSTLNFKKFDHLSRIYVQRPLTGIDSLIPAEKEEMFTWLNEKPTNEQEIILHKAFCKTELKIIAKDLKHFKNKSNRDFG